MARVPVEVRLHRRSRVLELRYEDGEKQELSAEYLRVHSPSAEVRGHGPGDRKLQSGKKHVAIEGVEPVGHYALRLVFDDGHDTGIYTWDWLEELGREHDRYWAAYLEELERANASRLPPLATGQWSPR